MASPSMTINAAGNVLASSALAAGASSANLDVDLSAKFEGQFLVGCTFGTVAATSGLQISVFRKVDSSPDVATVANPQFVLAATASTSQSMDFALPTGRYRIVLKNLDATNGLTAVFASLDTVDAVA